MRINIPIYVRWRTPNVGKKSGNIRDWIENFGSAYPYFIILDADSLMSPEAVMQLASAMDANPRVGLIQTVPRLVGGQTLFACLQQFAAGYYGPIVAAGLAAWHGDGGNYWGHNAIIRTGAFATSAGLPQLSGSAALGRAHPEPRLRGGGTAAARWMGGPSRSFPPGLVRGMPSDTQRVDSARPAMGAGQSAAPATAQCERPSVP